MPRAVIYCRVSTKEQTENLSLPTQKKACEEYCRREGWEVARIFMEEGESAKSADRTQLKELLTFCRLNKRRVQFVIVYNLSRFARESRSHHVLTGVLAALGVTLRSATEPIDDSPAGRLLEGVIASVAQFDNDVKAQRTKAGMRAALELGRWTFQAPIGYRTGVRGGPSLVHDPVQGRLAREAFDAFASGRISKRDLLARLKARGLKTRNGRALALQTLNSILRNPLYVGRVVVERWEIDVRGDFEPLVPEAIWTRTQQRLSGRAGAAVSHSRDNPDFPLRRFVRCGQCDRPLTGSWSRSGPRRYAYYHCAGCGGVRVPKADFEDRFRELLARLQPRPEYMRIFKAIVLDVWKDRQGSSRKERAELDKRIAALRQKLDQVEEAFLYSKVIDQTTYDRQRDRLREQVALAEVELDEATCEQLDVEGLLAFAEHVLTNAARLWEQASLDQKQRLQAALFPEGLRFEGSGFGTPVTCLAFAESLVSPGGADAVASPTGFEASPEGEPSSETVGQTRKDMALNRPSAEGNRRK